MNPAAPGPMACPMAKKIVMIAKAVGALEKPDSSPTAAAIIAGMAKTDRPYRTMEAINPALPSFRPTSR